MISRVCRLGFVVVAAFAALCLPSAGADAAPITLTYSGVGTGSLGLTEFVDAPFSFVVNADTTQASTPFIGIVYPAQTGIAFTVGATTVSLTDALSPVLTISGTAPPVQVGLDDGTGIIFSYVDDALTGYDFVSDKDTQNTAGILINAITARPTSGGNLTLSSVSAPRFTAVVAVVPEGSAASLLLLGVGLAGAIRRRRNVVIG